MNLFYPDRKPRNKTTPTFPSNCNDLNELGQTVNGLYLVQAGPLKNKIGVMFCSFEPENQRSEIPGIFIKKSCFILIKNLII